MREATRGPYVIPCLKEVRNVSEFPRRWDPRFEATNRISLVDLPFGSIGVPLAHSPFLPVSARLHFDFPDSGCKIHLALFVYFSLSICG